MPTTVGITTNYNGEVAGGYFAKMIKESNTIKDGLVTIMPDIVGKTSIRRIETSQSWLNYACGWTPGGSVTLTEKVLDPKKIMLQLDLCKEDFRRIWTTYEMGFSSHNDRLPATEQDAILLEIEKATNRKIDNEIWEGDNATGNLAGLIPQLIADVTVVKVATPVAITSANVEAQLGRWIDSISDEVLGSPDKILGVSTNVLRALRRTYGNQARANGTFLKPSEFDFEGYVLTEIKGLRVNTMVAYDKSNVVFGTGLLADHNEIRVKDMDETDLTGTVRMKAVLNGAIQYAWGGEIFLYRAA